MADIELVIKITKEDLRIICERTEKEIWEEYGGIDQRLMKAVQNGTPLPKGHGRLIDVSEYYKGSYNDAREFLDNAPTIIEADKVGDTNGNS